MVKDIDDESHNEMNSLSSVTTADAVAHRGSNGSDDMPHLEESPHGSTPESTDNIQDKKVGKISNGVLAIVIQIIPFISSLALSFLTITFVHQKFAPDHFIRRLIIPDDDVLQRALPAVILFIFFWATVDLLLKLFHIWRQNRFLQHNVVAILPKHLRETIQTEPLKSLAALPSKLRNTHFARRIIRLLKQLDTSQDKQKTHEHFRHQVDIDSDTVISSYSTVRVFIWAMPILGFIGTVIGIGIAVGNFSGFLTGDIDDINLVKRELSNVATGLSFAFNTTLLGLITSLFAMLFSSFVQKHDELSQKQFEELGLNIISNAKMDRKEPTSNDVDLLKHVEQTNALMQEQIETVQNSIEGFIKGVNGSAKMFLSTYPQISEVLKVQHDIMEKHQAQMVAGLADSLEKSQSMLNESANKLTTGIEDSAKLFNDTFTNFVTVLQKQYETIEQNQTQTFEGFSAILEKTNTMLASCTNDIGKNIEAFSQKVEKNSDSIRKLMERLSSATDKLESNVTANLSGLLQSTERAAVVLEDVVPAQQVTTKAIESVNELNGLLKEMQNNQEKLMPILKNLAGPLEFRLVPSNLDRS